MVHSSDSNPTWNTPLVTDLDWLIDRALEEDLRQRVDATTAALFPEAVRGAASFVARRSGVICGLPVINRVLERTNANLKCEVSVGDGDFVASGSILARLSGDAREILLVERTCLNFLGRMCGIASLTRQFVDRLAGTRARLLDTRKTTPGWRRLEKYAVACGGGVNHRLGLHDAILIKDNHLAMLQRALQLDSRGAVTTALQRGRQWIAEQAERLPQGASTYLQIEVDRLEQLEVALPLRPSGVLLDNMTFDDLRKAVAIRDRLAPEVELEASGGVNLDTVAGIAATGVERISVGAVTHSATNFDIGLDWELEPASESFPS